MAVKESPLDTDADDSVVDDDDVTLTEWVNTSSK